MNLGDITFIMQPRRVVELGTGDGMTAAEVMRVLPHGSTLTCVNWPNPPSGDDPRRYLDPFWNDVRLSVLFGDTRDPAIAAQVPDGIDLLSIDSTHEAACAAAEWELWRPKLADVALVVFDDLDHHDMRGFWQSLPYPRREARDGKAGIMLYRMGGA